MHVWTLLFTEHLKIDLYSEMLLPITKFEVLWFLQQFVKYKLDNQLYVKVAEFYRIIFLYFGI